jgi:large subunit ribosomal protein L19e
MEHIHRKKAESARLKTLQEQAEARRARSKAAHERKLARNAQKNAEMFAHIEDNVAEEES